MFRQRPVDKKMVQIVLFLQTSKPGLQRQSLHKDQIVLSSCELIIAFCSNVTLQRAPKGPMFAKSTILKKTFGNQSRDLLSLTQKCTTFIFHGLQHLEANNDHLHSDCLCETLQRGKRSSKAVIELDKLEFFHDILEVKLPR